METNKEQQYTVIQHFVPRFYARRWADNTHQFYCYDKNSKKIDRKGPHAICKEANLYEYGKINNNIPMPNDLENKFGIVENRVAKLLQKIDNILTNKNNKNSLIFQTDEKNILKDFAAMLLVRNPKYDIRELIDNLRFNQFGEIIDDIKTFIGEQLSDDFESRLFRNILIDPSFKKSKAVGGHVYNEAREDLDPLSVYILQSKTNKFCFSDFPVRVNEIGWFLPISASMAISFKKKDNKIDVPSNRIIPIKDSIVAEINSNYLHCNLCDYLFASNKEAIQEAVVSYESHNIN